MDESRFSARRWSAQQESSAGLTADEEDLGRHVSRPAVRAAGNSGLAQDANSAGPDRRSASPRCPMRPEQEATLIVRSLGPQIVQIKTHRLKPLPTEAAPAGQVQTARASYQYDPRTEATPQSEPAIVLTAVGNESAAAWVWDCDVRSQFAADGAADHVVSYRIQNAGSRQIRLTLPEGLARRDVHGIWVNDKPAAASGPIRAPEPRLAGELAVDLPADLKFVTLVLRISTRGEPLGTFARLRPPLPDIGLPVFARHWRLELPPGLCHVQLRPGSAGRADRVLQPPPLPAGLPGAKRRPIGLQPFAPRGLAIGAALAGGRPPVRSCRRRGHPSGSMCPQSWIGGRMDAIPDRPGRWHERP